MIFLQACADKLKREMEDFGCPPTFPEPMEDAPTVVEDKGDAVLKDKSKGKKVSYNTHCILHYEPDRL